MGTNRSPKGSYTRPTPDFYINLAATVGGFYWPTNPISTTFDLFNNAQDGSNLHVYKVWVGNDAAGLYAMTQVHGHGANLAQNAVPVITGTGTLPGQLWIDTQAAQYPGTQFPKDTILSDVFFADNEAGSQDTWAADGPICVVQPGYSLRAYTLVGAGQINGQVMAVTFYFLALRDAG